MGRGVYAPWGDVALEGYHAVSTAPGKRHDRPTGREIGCPFDRGDLQCCDRGADRHVRDGAPDRVGDGGRIAGHDERHSILVAVAAEAPSAGPRAVAGWVSVAAYRPRSCYSGIGEFSVYVARDRRGQGVGKDLLLALIEDARRQGYWKLVSRVFPFNSASRRLCKSCGFREVGVYEKHGKLDGKWLDTVIVERLIPENLV